MATTIMISDENWKKLNDLQTAEAKTKNQVITKLLKEKEDDRNTDIHR